MFLYKTQKRLVSDLVRTMVKKNRKPRVYNWVARGYQDFLKNTPFKRAPVKDIEQIPRDQWTPEIEQYMDGLNSAKKDQEEGLIETKNS